MSKALKMKDDVYLDSSSITHNEIKLSDILTNNVVTLYNTGLADMTLSSETIVPFNNANILGTYLSVDSSKTKITVASDKVKGVLISSHIDIQASTSTSTRVALIVKKNGTVVCRGRSTNITTIYGAGEANISNFYIPVEKGDYLEAYYSASGGSGSIGVYNNTPSLWFTCIAML